MNDISLETEANLNHINETATDKRHYTFNWIGEGYNQVYATSRFNAVKEIARQFSTCGLKPDLKTLKVCHNPDSYWASFPLMD